MHARAAAATTTALLGAAVVLPAHTAHAAVSTDQPLVIAHRGASAQAPENTLAAIDRAARLGFTWVENDVQRTKDGKLVVIHDDSLARTTDVEKVFPKRAPWKVKDFTAAEIARLDAGSWFSPRYKGARVPTLKQYMNRVSRNHQKLVLEIKNPQLYPGIERETLKTLSNEGWLGPAHVRSKLVIQSFSAASVRKVHALRPDVRTGFLGTPSVAELPVYARFADQINSSHTTISRAYVATIHALEGPHGRPLEISTWTVDTPADTRRVAGLGVNGIITNKPDVVRKTLREN
ncbi:glycerophosphodiester phosphodiesterase family protein [Streptomyces tauricus]|uniref:Glycerophosphodiester phosphodiesterase family protein n=1 Tax=Streptomyces tauricus TaxID=68274 RepID=A0ABZ1JQI0_9ACTN|nr:glycerophosphodiester phosphodiesterase family protein [Streptomyces tauricus]